MTLPPRLLVLGLSLVLAACPQPTEPPKPRAAAAPVASASPAESAGHAAGIAWRKDDVDGAFRAAKSASKPLFLYWGAVWCTPCNQVKATLFDRQDFIERSRFFVPVYIVGDGPSAQKL